MTDEQPLVDQSKPSIARVYDYLLDGKDNYDVDREIGDIFKRDLPGSVAIAFANRSALVRAVRELATTTEIDQFIDLGSGLPTRDNVHQVAQRHKDGARVVYVDSDPIVGAHGRALLEENERTRFIQADVREPRTIHDHRETQALIDFDRPVAVIFSAILHHVNDDEDPAGIVRFWRERVASGSHFFVSHFRSGNNPETAEAEAVLQRSFGRGRWRSTEEIAGLLDGLELLEPGVVPASQWRPDNEKSTTHTSGNNALTLWEQLIAAGMARKK